MRPVKPRRRPVVCSIGSVDPTVAAGIALDLHVYHRLGVAGVAVTAAVTAQNSRRVFGVYPIPAKLIREQLEALWETVRPDALCIGLLPNHAAIRAVRSFVLALRPRPPIVIDPVIAASSGHVFLGGRLRPALLQLFPLATIVTPNAHEASLLTQMPVATVAQAETAALNLARRGCAVVVTGGHLMDGDCTDVLAINDRVRRLAGPRIRGSMRGAGGILAAAIAAYLAKRSKLEAAVIRARRFVRNAQRNARALGSGRKQFSA